MDITGDYVFDVPQEIVWKALQDPNVLGAIVPGGQGFEQVGENQYTGLLQIKVGPVQGNFQGQIKLSDINAPESYQMEVDGKGTPGYVKATGRIRLETRGSQTHMDYTGTAQVGGRIASVGQRLMDSAARSIIRQSLEALNEYLKIEVAKQPQKSTAASPDSTVDGVVASAVSSEVSQAAPVREYKPPSRLKMGFNVAKDVLSDFIPPKYQPWLIGAIILIIALIIWLIVS